MFAKQHIILSRPKATVILCIGVLREIYSHLTIWPPQLLKFSPQWVGGIFHENHAISNNFSRLHRDNKEYKTLVFAFICALTYIIPFVSSHTPWKQKTRYFLFSGICKFQKHEMVFKGIHNVKLVLKGLWV